MTVWGEPIEVNGKRPAWLADDDRVNFDGIDRAAARWKYNGTGSYRLPADHWAYPVIAKGFTPWAGGDSAPDDWDGDEYGVLSRDGLTVGRRARSWRDFGDDATIIGYRTKPTDMDHSGYVDADPWTPDERTVRFCREKIIEYGRASGQLPPGNDYNRGHEAGFRYAIGELAILMRSILPKRTKLDEYLATTRQHSIADAIEWMEGQA